MNAQDELVGKMFSKLTPNKTPRGTKVDTNKQEGLREKIKEILNDFFYDVDSDYGEMNLEAGKEKYTSAILQQVTEWVEKELVSQCRDENNNYTELAQEIEIKIMDKLLQLKYDK